MYDQKKFIDYRNRVEKGEILIPSESIEFQEIMLQKMQYMGLVKKYDLGEELTTDEKNDLESWFAKQISFIRESNGEQFNDNPDKHGVASDAGFKKFLEEHARIDNSPAVLGGSASAINQKHAMRAIEKIKAGKIVGAFEWYCLEQYTKEICGIDLENADFGIGAPPGIRELASGPMFTRFLDHAETIRHFSNMAAAAPEKSALEMVEEFHTAFNCPVYVTPSLPSYNGAYSETVEHLFNQVSDYFNRFQIKDSRTLLRMKLIFEEYKELCEAMREGNFVKILDGLCDLLYVTYGTAHEFGLGPVLKEAFREVHRSNMSKLNGDGTPIIRNDGKVLKGPNFIPPDLAGILDRQKAKDGVIYSNLEVGAVTQSDDGSINIEINGTKHTPVESVKATILFAPGSPELKAAKNIGISTDDIELVKTCGACPEQYDAFYQGKQVGYLRLRHGHFTVDYLKCNGEEIFSAQPDGDGIFEPDEREFYLTAAKNSIIHRMIQDLSGPWAMGPGQ